MRRELILSIMTLTLAGCGNNPVTFGGVPVQASAITASPAYSAADTYSFSLAKLSYPAAGGASHTIPVGDYLLAGVLKILGPSRVSDIKMVRFSAPCVMTSDFFSRVTCRAEAEIAYRQGSVSRRLAGQVDLDVGHMRLRSTIGTLGLEYRDYGESDIHAQAKMTMDALLAAMARDRRS